MNTLAMGGDKMKGIYMDDPSQRDQLNEWEKETLMKFSKKMKDKSKPPFHASLPPLGSH